LGLHNKGMRMVIDHMIITPMTPARNDIL
jgi:hypothetical protein